MRETAFRSRRALGWIPAVALALAIGVSPPAVAERTPQDRLSRRVEKLVSPISKPGKVLCVCMSDAYPYAPKRVGVLSGGTLHLNSTYVAVTCFLPAYDSNGELLPGMPETCGTWVPIAK